MIETAEELAAEHTRRELEGMAEKLGIGMIGTDKLQLAKTIIEAEEKARGTSESKAPEMKAPETKAAEMKKSSQRIGKTGVFAKRAAIDAQIKENEEAAAVIGAGVMEIQNSIMDMRSAIDTKAMEMQKGIDEMYSGIDEIRRGIDEMCKSIDAQIKANEKAAAKMGMSIKKMHSGIEDMENEFREFQNETANYIKDFYYA